MRFHILHRTVYSYDEPPDFSAQVLKLTARQDASQSVVDWKVSADGSLHPWVDAFCNNCHTLINGHGRRRIEIVAEGEVITKDGLGVLPGFGDDLPRELFLGQTARTRPDERMKAFADDFRPLVMNDALNGMHQLMKAVRDRVEYESGVTDVSWSGAEAFAGSRGVCQDHAHIFLGCARHLGVPARYVSGYLYNGEQEHPFQAGHAWASAWIDNLGWVGFDISNGISPHEHHIGVATGLDYDSAAPVRGTRNGEAVGENLTVELTIRAVS